VPCKKFKDAQFSVTPCNGKTLTEDQLIFKSGRIFSRRCVINKVLREGSMFIRHVQNMSLFLANQFKPRTSATDVNQMISGDPANMVIIQLS